MKNVRGQGVYIGRDEAGRETSRETVTCAHCNTPFLKPLPGEPTGFCVKCMQGTCLKCGGSDRCVPFEAKIERYERRMRFRATLTG